MFFMLVNKKGRYGYYSFKVQITKIDYYCIIIYQFWGADHKKPCSPILISFLIPWCEFDGITLKIVNKRKKVKHL